MFNENTKKRTTHTSFPFYASVLLVVGTALALSYIWLDIRSRSLGAYVHELERDRTEVRRRYDNELWRWESAISPSNIEAMLKIHDVVMIWPDEINVVRVNETDVTALSHKDLAGQVAQIVQLR